MYSSCLCECAFYCVVKADVEAVMTSWGRWLMVKMLMLRAGQQNPQHTDLPPPTPHPHSPRYPSSDVSSLQKNNESEHLQPLLHWCLNKQPADSKTHSGIKAKKKKNGREKETERGMGGGVGIFVPITLWARRHMGYGSHLLRLWGKLSLKNGLQVGIKPEMPAIPKD